MNTKLLALTAALLVGLTVPTAAVTLGQSATAAPSAETAGPVTLTPADGPNGEYATMESGELHVAFDRLNEDAVTTADRVFTVGNDDDQQVRVWVTTDAGPGVRAYVGDDPANRVASPENAVRLGPDESIGVGFRIDTHGTAPAGGDVTVHARFPNGTTTTGPPGTTDEPNGTVDEPNGTTDDGSANVTVTGVSVPSEPTVGNATSIVATLVNDGTATGEYQAELLIDGTVVAVETVTAPVNESVRVEFTHVFDQRGTYDVRVGSASSQVTVMANGNRTAELDVVDVDVGASELVVGNATTVTATVRNSGNASGTFEVDLVVAGVVVATERVGLSPGEATTVEFAHTFTQQGVYPVAVEGVAAGEVTITTGTTPADRRLPSSVQTAAAVPAALGLLFLFRRRPWQ